MIYVKISARVAKEANFVSKVCVTAFQIKRVRDQFACEEKKKPEFM